MFIFECQNCTFEVSPGTSALYELSPNLNYLNISKALSESTLKTSPVLHETLGTFCIKLCHKPVGSFIVTNFTLILPYIVTNFFIIKPNRCSNYTNLF